MGKVKYPRLADIDTAPAGNTIRAGDNRTGEWIAGIQRGGDHLGFRTNPKAITAVGAGCPVFCADSRQAEAIDQAVEGAHGADVSTPAVLQHKQIK